MHVLHFVFKYAQFVLTVTEIVLLLLGQKMANFLEICECLLYTTIMMHF